MSAPGEGEAAAVTAEFGLFDGAVGEAVRAWHDETATNERAMGTAALNLTGVSSAYSGGKTIVGETLLPLPSPGDGMTAAVRLTTFEKRNPRTFSGEVHGTATLALPEQTDDGSHERKFFRLKELLARMGRSVRGSSVDMHGDVELTEKPEEVQYGHTAVRIEVNETTGDGGVASSVMDVGHVTLDKGAKGSLTLWQRVGRHVREKPTDREFDTEEASDEYIRRLVLTATRLALDTGREDS